MPSGVNGSCVMTARRVTVDIQAQRRRARRGAGACQPIRSIDTQSASSSYCANHIEEMLVELLESSLNTAAVTKETTADTVCIAAVKSASVCRLGDGCGTVATLLEPTLILDPKTMARKLENLRKKDRKKRKKAAMVTESECE